MTHTPFAGFWQVLQPQAKEDIREFRNTTTALRSTAGFVLYTKSYFMELRITGQMELAAGWPPTDNELGEMFRHFYGVAGRCQWEQSTDGWQSQHSVLLASNPAQVGTQFTRTLAIQGSEAINGQESWRQLSGAGHSQLSGAWETRNDMGHWLYLTCAGHYGVMRSEAGRVAPQSEWAQAATTQLSALAQSFGANAGARLETGASFDHWPMIGQVAGYDVRKHETFKLEAVQAGRFEASLPPLDFPPDQWTRLE